MRVRVTPRGGRDAVIGFRAEDGVLLLRVASPPVDGAANRACLSLLAAVLGLKKAQVSLVGGETSREKRFLVSGVTPEELDRRLALLPRTGDESP
ncbi:MAG: DUF167 domain-containing protein [Armatimonadota bacterium]